MPGQGGRRRSWTLLTSHGHVLVEIARNPGARLRELAVAAGLTERSAASIAADLVDAGYVTRERVGRCNRYMVHLDRGFRHPAQANLQVGPFLAFLTGGLLPQPPVVPVVPMPSGLPAEPGGEVGGIAAAVVQPESQYIA
jgi:hypothetical protein